ncbi:hypothetical protein Scep_023947 [Stephania cephalantha]|uniref:Nodulin-like domain-containing protein n=1 Tax=Stephania cephalantha TaxID=152367 RepID=A0AAP0F126_9MAGN
MVTVKVGSRPPWVGLGAAVWVQIAGGNAGSFALYSHSLKSVLGFTQQQLTMIGVANDIGENVGLLPGIVCNKFPPWLLLLIGALCCFLGYGVVWLAVSKTVLYMPYWIVSVLVDLVISLSLYLPFLCSSTVLRNLNSILVASSIGVIFNATMLWKAISRLHGLWIAFCIATNSSAWMGTAVLVTNMRNFPLSRGTVAGILKGYGGLSAAVYTEICALALKNSSSKFLLFLAVGIPALCLALMYLVRPCTPASGEDSSEHGHFIFVITASVVLGIYILATTVLNDVLFISDAVSYALLAIMVVFLLAPLAIPIKMTFYPSNPQKSGVLARPSSSSDQLNLGEGITDKTEPLLTPSSSAAQLGSFYEGDAGSDIDILLAVGEGAVKKKRRPKRGEDFSLIQAFMKADFWLLFLVYFVGVGTGVTVLNNLAQIGVAAGAHDTTILLSLFSFCNFLGRLSGGAVSEHLVSISYRGSLKLAIPLYGSKTRTIPRTILMTCTQITMIVAYLLFASSLDGTLHAAIALLGICYGVQFSVLVPTASELFGLKNFGLIFNFMSLGNPLGALLFSGWLAGYVYDKEAAKQHGFNLFQSTVSCLGPNCFRLTFLILAGVCCVGTLLSIILTIRIRPVYQMLYSGGSFRVPPTSSH